MYDFLFDLENKWYEFILSIQPQGSVVFLHVVQLLVDFFQLFA